MKMMQIRRFIVRMGLVSGWFAYTLALRATTTDTLWNWNLEEMGKFESTAWWAGPWPGEMRLINEAREGRHALEVDVELESGRQLRIERNFVHGSPEGLDNMMGLGMREENLSSIRGLQFQFNTNVSGGALVVRLWDRVGGWLEWTAPISENEAWTTQTRTIPTDADKWINLCRTGGIQFEIKAGRSPLRGHVRFDDLKFLTTDLSGLSPTPHQPADDRFEPRGSSLPPVASDTITSVRLVLNMTPMSWALWDCDAALAISEMKQVREKLKSVRGLQYFFGPETRRRIDPTQPEDAAWLARSRTCLVEVATWCESNSVSFYLSRGMEGHGLTPPETVFAVLDAAPQFCLGVVMGEASVESNGNIHNTVEVLERLRRDGKKLLYYQQSSYWLGIMHPRGDEFIREILAPRFKDVFVPMWENLLPSSPGLCYATVLGLWRGGLTSHWGLSAQSWGYTNMNFGGTSDMPGHWWFRMLLMAVASGATFIEIEPSWVFDLENTPEQIRHFKQWSHNLAWVGRRRAQIDIDLDPAPPVKALTLFSDMLAKGLVAAPATPADCVSFSSLAIQMRRRGQSYPWGLLRRAMDRDWWQMSDCPNSLEMAARVPATELFQRAYSSDHFYDQTLPDTSFGLISIFPEQVTVPAGVEVLRTDARRLILQSGEGLEEEAAARAVGKRLLEASRDLPFQAERCFLSVVRWGSDSYRAFLIDAEERFPRGTTTLLQLRLPGNWRAYDAESGAELEIMGSTIEVRIEPASYRIIHLTQKQ